MTHWNCSWCKKKQPITTYSYWNQHKQFHFCNKCFRNMVNRDASLAKDYVIYFWDGFEDEEDNE